MSGPRVAVVGAGLAGLVAAHTLQRAGIDDVTVVEARDRVGGRVRAIERGDRPPLEAGGELVMGAAPNLLGIAGELGIPLRDVPEPAPGGRLVRITDGERYVEDIPFADDAVLARAVAEGSELLGALAAEIDPVEPWRSERARELDVQTLAGWLTRHVSDARARHALEARFHYLGGSGAELSLLHCLWYMGYSGDTDEFFADPWRLLEGGTSRLVARLLDAVGRERVLLGAPVRMVQQSASTVTLHTDEEVLHADAAIVAISPTLCSRIAWQPRLSPMRGRLQHRWLQGRGVKLFAVYDERWWTARGYTGEAFGDQPVSAILDISPADGSEWILLGFAVATGENVLEHGDTLADDERARAAFVEALERYFGPDAPPPREVHVASWFGDPWSDGCGTGTPPGVLSTVGAALGAPVGRITWAGEETAAAPHMDGAVASGRRAAAQVLELLGGATGRGEREARV